jgi:hypothetical protein
VDVKKELLLTSLLAITLAVGLGALSFGLFSETTPNVQIDVSATKNGVAGLSFLPEDQVFIEAHVSSNNASVVGTPVNFEVKSPNGTDFPVQQTQPVRTNSLGIANITFQIPWPSDWASVLSPESMWVLGTWQTKATAKAYGQTLDATTNFTCETLTPTIDLYTEKGGRGPNAPSGNFTTDETVTAYVEARDELNQTVPSLPVGFESLKYQAVDNIPTISSNATDALGIASFNVRYPGNLNAPTAYEDIATAPYSSALNMNMTLTDSMIIIVQPSG